MVHITKKSQKIATDLQAARLQSKTALDGLESKPWP
jgi:hypothetical protein